MTSISDSESTQHTHPQEITTVDLARQPELGDAFEPLLCDACEHRLGSIGWFRADWQRGGARTGRATFKLEPNQSAHPVRDEHPEDGCVEVVVKIPVGPTEYIWNRRMQPDEEDPNGITARTFASGTELGGYDLAWIVMEKFAAGPLFGLHRPDGIELIADAAARFYRRANRFEIKGVKRNEDWDDLFERAREACRSELFPNSQTWHKAIKAVQKKADTIVTAWNERPVTGWIHGDMHPANVMSRSDEDPSDPAMLIDLAEVRVGHWVEDAVYLERLYWARRSIIDEHPPVKLIADARKRLGIANGERDGDTTSLANIRRALLAATSPAFLPSEGNPRYLASCLEVLEETIPKLK